jgi:hypothetical protein
MSGYVSSLLAAANVVISMIQYMKLFLRANFELQVTHERAPLSRECRTDFDVTQNYSILTPSSFVKGKGNRPGVYRIKDIINTLRTILILFKWRILIL